jgi:hypothetical protein
MGQVRTVARGGMNGCRPLYLPPRARQCQSAALFQGLVFRDPHFNPRCLSCLQVEFEDLFDPLRIDLVPLQRVDALFQYNAIDGHRIAATDSVAADRYELTVMNRASELVPLQRQRELELFGVSTT